jgi:hypothetical protein
MLDVDHLGLDVMDRKLLGAMLEKFGGGPVGVDNLAAAIGEARDTIEDVLEPYLIQQGYLQRTPRGRVATAEHLATFRAGDWGSLICQRRDFEAIDGYDEAFTGWGGEDDDLMMRLALLGRKSAGYSAELIDEIPHDEAARVRFHDIKDRALQHRINMLYMQAKLDLSRLLGGPLPLETRQQLNGEVKRIIRLAADTGQPAAIVEVGLPAQLIKPPPINGLIEHWHLNRKMVYSIDIAAHYIERT